MPIIIPSGLLRGERIGKLSDEARMYWSFFYAGSNGYGRIRFDYRWIIEHCFAQFTAKPTKETVVRLLREYTAVHLLFVYKANGETWGAWDSVAKQKYYSREDERSPQPPAEEFAAWKRQYQDSKRSNDIDGEEHDLSTEFGEFPSESQEFPSEVENFREKVKISPGCTTTTTTTSTSQPSLNINNSSREGGVGGNPAQRSQPIPIRTGITASDGFPEFYIPYCQQTGKPVTDDDRECALMEWGLLSFDDKLRAVQYIPAYVAEENPSHPKYFKTPANYLKKRPWTAVSMKPPGVASARPPNEVTYPKTRPTAEQLRRMQEAS